MPLSGSYTFDIKPYLCEGQTQVTFNFYVEGTDNIIGGSGVNVGGFTFDPNKIYILLKWFEHFLTVKLFLKGKFHYSNDLFLKWDIYITDSVKIAQLFIFIIFNQH